jgi:hypothetical protein
VVPSHFDVAADGRFLMTRSVGAARHDELTLVQNFFEELKAKVSRNDDARIFNRKPIGGLPRLASASRRRSR